MLRMRSNCLTISEKQTNHAQQKFGSLQEFSLQGMILSLFAWAKITNQGRLCPEKITIFEEKHKKEQNISFILFASEESKIHFEIPSTIGNARSKKLSNCTTTRLRWNSPKFLDTISYEISWSTTKTTFYTRKISIFSVDLVTEWGYESDPHNADETFRQEANSATAHEDVSH